MKIIKESLSPEVGPFYVIDGVVFNDTDSLRKVSGVNGMFDSDNTHYDFWKLLQRIYPEYRRIDYDYYPRGRVVYNKNKDEYRIFIDKCITSKNIKEIISELNLPWNKVVTDYDEHYQCHSCNPDYAGISESYGFCEDPPVSIWWYLEDKRKFVSFSEDIDKAPSSGEYLQYSSKNNHLTLWRSACKKISPENWKSYYDKGYKSLERGRVVYNLKTQCYEILCSERMSRSSNFIKDCFNQLLKGSHCRHQFVKCDHYFVAELTGNPELDRFTYEVY